MWRFKVRNLCVCLTVTVKYRGTTNTSPIWDIPKRLYANMDDSLQPPSEVRGMKALDKKMFIKNVTVPCLYLPCRSIQSASKYLKSYLLKIPNFRPITDATESLFDNLSGKNFEIEKESKMAVMDPRKVKSFNDIDLKDRLGLENIGIDGSYLVYINLSLNYDNWKADEILRAVIPVEFDAVSGYSIIGHIVHLNLRECLTEYKYLIGSVLLDKVKNARAVVNKIDNIDSTYRNFNMELLCGDSDMVTQVQENKCSFKFDFSKVYWNPRLSTEHERIVKLFNKGDIFYDVFAGVGPFSIPAAKKGCITLANDLNPDSIKWLRTNISLNKIADGITVFNKDGHNFIIEDIKHHLLTLKPGEYSIHIAMNLPAFATTFLPDFINLFNEKEMEQIKLLPIPKVYLYTFAKGLENSSELASQSVEEALGQKLKNEIIDVFFVRDVAPNKRMMRVTILLSGNILSNKKRIADDERVVKKLCL